MEEWPETINLSLVVDQPSGSEHQKNPNFMKIIQKYS